MDGQIEVCVIVMDKLPLDIDSTQNEPQWIPYLYTIEQNSISRQ